MNFPDFGLTLGAQAIYRSLRSMRLPTIQPVFPSLCRIAWWVAACLAADLAAAGPASDAGLAQREQVRLSAAIEEGQELLRKGDEAYQAGHYADAMEAYSGAVDLIPAAPVSAELHAAAVERNVQASIEQARALSRKGDVAGAKAAVDKVLRAGAAPGHPAALALRAQLDDPIRTNPALDAKHAQHIDAVRRKLYTAEGAYNLGKFTEATKHYQEVLRIDPTNSAARRGMEQVAVAKSRYAKSAYDQTRAEMLDQVAAGWELAAPAPDLGTAPPEPGLAPDATATVTTAAKLERIIIPKISLEQATLDEAIDFLRTRAAEFDTFEQDPARRGVNFTVNLGAPDSEIAKRIRNQRINLRLLQVPISQILKYITENTHTTYKTDEFAVIITPAGSSSDELVSRNYRVPPDFLTTLSSGAAADTPADDPFAAAGAARKEGLLAKRLSAKEALAKQGVSFPEGASASLSAATNILQVVNTATNQEAISQIIEAMSKTEPVTIVVKVTMIKTQRTNLAELGFDWLISPFPVNGANSLFAGGGTLGNGTPRTGNDFISPVNGIPIPGVPALPTATVNSGGATNGLRSGDYAIAGDALDNLINNPNRETQVRTVAPGILSLTGLFSDGQAQMILRGLDQKKNVDLMAQPAIVTRSGQSSKVEIIQELRYPTEYEPPQLPQSVGTQGTSPATPATPTAFQERSVGISLEVLPVADANKRYVDVTLAPQFSALDGFVNYGTPINATRTNALGVTELVNITPNQILMPVFSNHKLNTQLTVEDGATIALGGLMQERVQNVQDKVPLLGDIPWLGRLFTSESKQSVETAIIFLVHIELLDPTGRPYRNR